MKTLRQALAISVLSFILVLSLCACGNHQKKLVGTWAGNGDLDILGSETPFEFAQQWTFRDDGTAVVLVDSEPVEFSIYRVSDDGDTLTLIMDGSETSWGILYQIKGDTLSIKTGSGYAEFTRVDS